MFFSRLHGETKQNARLAMLGMAPMAAAKRSDNPARSVPGR
jgi:hypothetical protein